MPFRFVAVLVIARACKPNDVSKESQVSLQFSLVDTPFSKTHIPNQGILERHHILVVLGLVKRKRKLSRSCPCPLVSFGACLSSPVQYTAMQCIYFSSI
ncbi:hypothetical protein KC19_1G208200 [Ceratodon purpureus]|uniref:Uncharacterized protein n=1 Tax=Ceratodon purpureus TaxID=3225 RepID=A0A8T0JAB5_CERPU|nr:hypothetical protein KC19_1G208200 [Ceratodon purpureus]